MYSCSPCTANSASTMLPERNCAPPAVAGGPDVRAVFKDLFAREAGAQHGLGQVVGGDGCSIADRERHAASSVSATLRSTEAQPPRPATRLRRANLRCTTKRRPPPPTSFRRPRLKLVQRRLQFDPVEILVEDLCRRQALAAALERLVAISTMVAVTKTATCRAWWFRRVGAEGAAEQRQVLRAGHARLRLRARIRKAGDRGRAAVLHLDRAARRAPVDDRQALLAARHDVADLDVHVERQLAVGPICGVMRRIVPSRSSRGRADEGAGIGGDLEILLGRDRISASLPSCASTCGLAMTSPRHWREEVEGQRQRVGELAVGE